MRTRKVLSVFLAVLMLLSVMPMNAFAEGISESSISSIDFTAKSDKVVYEYLDGEVIYDARGNWYRYNMPKFEVGDELTVTYKDSTQETYFVQSTDGYNARFVTYDYSKSLDSYGVCIQYDSDFEQSYENQFTYGSYYYYVAIQDPDVSGEDGYFNTKESFTFAPCPVTSIELDFAPITVTENQGGYYQTDLKTYEQYYCYRFNYFVEGNKITVHRTDGDIVYTCSQYVNEYGQTTLDFVDENGNLYPVTDFSYNDNQADVHWYGGNTYQVTYKYLDRFETTFDVTVNEAPKSISVEGYKGGSAYENTGGYTTSAAGIGSFYYYVTPSLCYGDTVLTVSYENQPDKVYHVESRYNEEYGYTYYVFVDENGGELTEQIATVDDQYSNPWDVGEHTYHFEIFGLSTQDFTFNVIEAPYDFELSGYNGGSAVENENGYYDVDGNGDTYFHYWLPGICGPGVTLTLKFRNSEDKVYTATEIYDEEEGWTHWEFVDEQGNSPEQTPFTNDPQGSEHWSAGEHTYTVRLGDISKRYTFTVEEAAYDVVIDGFDGNRSVMENTEGYTNTDDNGDDYFEYFLPGVAQEGVTITLKYNNKDDVVYTATEFYDEEEDWNYWTFVNEEGEELDVYSSSDQYEEHWGVGEHIYYVNCGGNKVAYTFTVLPGPERVEFEFSADHKTTFLENIDGYFDEETGNFIYNIPYPKEEGNTITLYYPEEYGIAPETYTCKLLQNEEEHYSYYDFVNDETGAELNVSVDYDFDQNETPLSLGENTVALYVGGLRTEVVFTVLGGPVSMEFTPVRQITLYENVSGYYDEEAGFFRYEPDFIFEEGNILKLVYDDERGEVTYVATLVEHDSEWSEILYINSEDENDILDTLAIGIESNQESEWALGKHEISVTYGSVGCPVEVEVAESPVKSISFAFADGTPVYPEGENMVERYVDASEEPIMVYSAAWALLREGNTITVNMKNGDSITYTARTVGDGEVAFFDGEDRPLEIWTAELRDDQAENPWGPGEHTFTLIFMGASTDINVIVGDSSPWEMYVEAYDQNGNIYTDGDVITIKPGESEFIYFMTDENNYYHGVSPFVGFSDGYPEGTLTAAGFVTETGAPEDFGFEVEHEDAFGLLVKSGDLVAGAEGTLTYHLYVLPEDFTWEDMDSFDFATTPHAADYSLTFRVEFRNGWNQVGDNWYYFENGVLATGWKQIRNIWYYFDSEGVMQTGFADVNGKRYYFNDNGAMQTGLFKVTFEDNYYNWYYANASGALQEGWQTVSGKRYYFFPGEYFMVFGGFNKIDGKTYYLTENGAVTGWKQIGGKWYYFATDGAMQTGWQKISNVWYYFDSEGVMQTGLQVIGGKTYLFASGGAMQTGWQKISNKWHYFASGGAMQTGWQKISNVWYYFDSEGVMLTGWQKIGNVWYYFNSGGAMQTGWQKISNKWYYFASSGAMQTGWKKISNKWYYFEPSGAMRTANLKYKGKTYRFNSSGACLNP